MSILNKNNFLLRKTKKFNLQEFFFQVNFVVDDSEKLYFDKTNR